jgi:hypothetical protein
MEKTFHLSNKWYPTFKESLKKVERDVSEQEHFFRYCNETINPALQRLLMRTDNVIFALARYIIRDRVREKQKELEAQKNFYPNGEWRRQG